MTRRKVYGIASGIAAISLSIICGELAEDLLEGKQHFPLPEPMKVLCLFYCGLMAIMEWSKARRALTERVKRA
ncbi:MAG TPA: hypothetical protein VMW79_06040 [Anaerolineae bacterium]|nr:hypothetical protein [Anaerolineae bacterium]HUW96007.1 hypothetical protein [Anaerolineae bacterium]